ncbi:MAG: tandem-95 repeat protein [Gemmataceae bacterium]|nr:tandem-95 repeat protein [Gemmataceae bacterium]
MMVEALEDRQLLNAAPIAANDGLFSVHKGATLQNLDLEVNDSDPDGDATSISIANYPNQGSLYQDYMTGKWNFSAPSYFAGLVTFTYRLYDGALYSDPATVTIDVTNAAPIAANDGTFSVHHGQTLTGLNLKANDSDPDGDTTTISLLSYPSQGYVYQDYYTGNWSYSAPSSYVGVVTFSYRLYDGAEYSSPATVTIEVTNQAPIAADDGTYSVRHGQTLTGINLKANDSDPDGDSTSVSILSYPTQGYIYQDYYTGNWNYSAPSSYVGPVSFTYQLYDGAQYSNTATVTIDVTNTAPVALDDGAYSVLHGQTLTGMNLKANDIDADGDSTSISILSYPSQGYLYQDYYTGNWNYSAPSSFAGIVTFTYRLYDGAEYSNTATVTIDVTNSAPIAANDGIYSVLHGQTLTNLDFKANDSDPDGDSTTLQIVNGPTKGNLYQDWYTGKWNYSAYSNATGIDVVTYRLYDGAHYSNTATITFDVTNQAPIAADDGMYSIRHGQTLTGMNLKANDSDPDGDSTTLSILSYPGQGYLYQDYSTGNWNYSAPSSFAGIVTFTYQLYDGAQYSSPAMVTIDVTNQAPIAADLDPLFVLHGRTISGIDLLGAASDPDADSLSVQIVSYPTQGYLYQDWYTGKWNYSAPSSYAGPVAFSYRVYDGQAYSNTANVSIEVTNQAPNANADWVLSPASGTSINILANDTDPDGDPLAITNYTQPNYGSLLLQGSGSEAFFIYTPYAGTSASMDTFEYTVSDGHGGSSTATVMVSFRTLLKFDTVTHETVYGTQNGAISIERTGGDLSNLLYVPLHFASLGNEAVPSIDFDLLDGLQVVTYGVTFLPGETKKTLWVVAHTNPEGIFPQLSAYATAAPSELWGVDPETFADITITPAPSAVGRIIGFAESTQSEKNLDQATDAKFFC